MLSRLITYLRSQSLAIAALLIAIGGSGGYAIAATSHATSSAGTTIHTCEVKKTGELLVRSRCGRGEAVINLAHTFPKGLANQTAYIYLSTGTAGSGVNATGQYIGNGQYKINVTPGLCPTSKPAYVNATPFGGSIGAGATPASTAAATVDSSGSAGQGIIVRVGVLQSGVFTPSGPGAPSGAYVEINC